MGVLKALLPDGTTVEREICRHTVYNHGLAVLRMGRWVLVSVHRKKETAQVKGRRLALSLKLDEAFCSETCVKVVPLVPIGEAA